MLGNYIFDKHGNIHIVNLFTLKEIDEIPKSHGYKPIPLTEDWLLKFKEIYLIGKCSSRYAYREGYYCFGSLYLSKDFELCTEDYDSDCMPGLCTQIKHVHQLQNLYFALENKELEIKL